MQRGVLMGLGGWATRAHLSREPCRLTRPVWGPLRVSSASSLIPFTHHPPWQDQLSMRAFPVGGRSLMPGQEPLAWNSIQHGVGVGGGSQVAETAQP